MLDLLLKETFIRTLFGWLALLTPLAALLVYGIVRLVRKKHAGGNKTESDAKREGKSNARHCRWIGLWVFGLAGPLVWLLWQVYEAIMNATGFASVRGLLIVLTLFLTLGLLLGWLLGRWTRERES